MLILHPVTLCITVGVIKEVKLTVIPVPCTMGQYIEAQSVVNIRSPLSSLSCAYLTFHMIIYGEEEDILVCPLEVEFPVRVTHGSGSFSALHRRYNARRF
jgi:hypothetical protein